MKDSGRSLLGYLAAFTMGVVSTAVIVYVVRHRDLERQPSPPPPAPLSPSAPADAPTTPSVRRQTFQRLPRPSASPEPAAQPPVQEEAPKIAQEQPPEPIVEQPPAPAPVEVRHTVAISVSESRPSHSVPSGRISGKVTFLGDPPAEIPIGLDPTCAKSWERLRRPATTRHYLLGKDRGLADVIVSLRLDPQPGDWIHPRSGETITIQNCFFDPYISAIQAGQTVVVENRDRSVHNLHMTATANDEFNRALLPNREARIKLTTPEQFIRFKCDVHPWEFAYVSVFDHPYFAVTDRNGVFVLQDVPPGTYTLEARHRKAGTLTKEITVTPHRNQDVQLQFHPRTE